MKTIQLTDQQIEDISCMLQNIHLIPLFKDKKDLAKQLVEALNRKQLVKGKGKEVIQVLIRDYTEDVDEPGYDVELFIDGEYDRTYDGIFSSRGTYAPKDNGWYIRRAYRQALQHSIGKLNDLLDNS